MTIEDPLRIIAGDALVELGRLRAGSVQCAVTSPPYWGLRDYGIDPTQWPAVEFVPMAGLPPVKVPAMECCLGLEPTIEAFVGHSVLIFREVHRVLREDGTLWLNFGDSYNSHPGQRETTDKVGEKQQSNGGSASTPSRNVSTLKPKDMAGIPWRVAFALQAEGWWLRMDNIWSKPNPMPESVSDRPTKAHEYVFLLSKAQRYFYDAEAITEPCSPNTNARLSQDVANQIGSARAYGGAKKNGTMKAVVRGSSKAAQNAVGSRQNESFASAVCLPVSNRNKRSVWTVTTQGYKEAHFATFPPELIRPCILAGTSAGGCCAGCGTPLVRMVEKTGGNWEERKEGGDPVRYGMNNSKGQMSVGNYGSVSTKTVGWSPGCECAEVRTVPCTVLDMFGGSGTTGMVALQEGRRVIVMEKNPAYIPLIRQRCAITPGLPAVSNGQLIMDNGERGAGAKRI